MFGSTPNAETPVCRLSSERVSLGPVMPVCVPFPALNRSINLLPFRASAAGRGPRSG